jgi:FtsP/CotA-like multicopper oxidase with cupredoxin domain
MKPSTSRSKLWAAALAAAVGAAAPGPARAVPYVQCPHDQDQDAIPDEPSLPGETPARCMHLTAGDGFVRMADGRVLYIFGFTDVTGTPPGEITMDTTAATFAAPTIDLSASEDFYLTVTNVGMTLRPDLFDPHTVHFHGKAQAAPVFDGMPEGSFGVNMGSSFTYYYARPEPGTYMYHCHMEATEHMQMGMLGNLFVRPAQDGTPITYGGREFSRFVYEDGDGSTGYDVGFALQLGSMDHVFHELHLAIQPLPFADMRDTYALINGRGYPDTINPDPLPGPDENGNQPSQPVSSLVRATQGDRVLLRLSNLNVTNHYTVTALGLPMKVVGRGARQLRGPTGLDASYETASVNLGGGESMEVMIDTAQVAAGTYFLYATELNFLSNFDQDHGGMMTEIVIDPAPGP